MKILKTTLVLCLLVGLFSCNEQESLNPTAVESEISSRSNGIDSSLTPWLNQLRLNLLDQNASYSLTLEQTKTGLESLYNIYAARGVSDIQNQQIINSSITLSNVTGNLNETQITSVSDMIFNTIKNYVGVSSPGLQMLDVSYDNDPSTNNVIFSVDAFVGNLSVPDFTSGTVFDCENGSFDLADCYRSASGDADVSGFPIITGGECGEISNVTSAQEETQKAIVAKVPRHSYQIISGDLSQVRYVYTNQEEEFFELWFARLDGFPDWNEVNTNCPSYYSRMESYNDNISILDEIEYEGDELNCTECDVMDYMISICPPGKVICGINMWGDELGSSDVKWVAEAYFCDLDVEVVNPVESGPVSLPDDIEDLFGGM